MSRHRAPGGRRAPDARVAGVVLACVCALAVPGAAQAPPPGGSAAASLCLSCHDELRGPSHPLGVRAPATTGLPLDAGGRITCLTCHLLHGDAAPPGLLRAAAADLCARCHGWSASGHRATSWMVHLPAAARRAAGGFPHGLDPTTTLCLGCHDGLTAPGTGHAPQGPLRLAARSTLPTRGAHPLGADYVRLSGWRSQLRDPAELDPRVILDGGKVGCLSCHDPFAATPGRLVMANRYSRLCLECHRL